MVEAAVAAGNLMYRRLGRIKKISYKGRMNLVTDVDKAAEALIIKKLSSVYNYQVLAEESAPDTRSAETKWVIDPLDGTTNFAHGFTFFCVSIALEYKGRPVVGVVYEPVRKEIFSAIKAKGAYLGRKKIRVSKVRRLSGGLLATGFPYGYKKATTLNVKYFKKFLRKAQAIRRAGSAALDLCYVACGRFDGFWEMDLNPWDTAAGSLIVSEAGGRLSDFKGRTFSHYKKEVCATNGKIHRQMLEVLKI